MERRTDVALPVAPVKPSTPGGSFASAGHDERTAVLLKRVVDMGPTSGVGG